MRAQLLAGLRTVVVLTILCGLAFPLFVTLVAQVAFNDKADGSLIERDGKVVGSSLIGQTFTQPEYFHPRPSAAGAAASGSYVDVLDDNGEPTGKTVPADPNDLTGVASSASNFGPTNREFLATVADRVQAYREENGLDDNQRVPVDAVTASGSGLDPQISVANARLQAARVAEARNVTVDDVDDLIDDHTQSRSLGFLGEKGVNVLELNLALDALSVR
jgi:K+-transporting ATPase ATPase C chain